MKSFQKFSLFKKLLSLSSLHFNSNLCLKRVYLSAFFPDEKNIRLQAVPVQPVRTGF
jgi:hypothetical protein